MTATLRSSLLLLSLLTLLLAAGPAGAAKVDLSNGSSSQTGSQKLDIDDVGTCNEFFSLNVNFVNKKKWSAVDNLGNNFSGKYKQKSGKGGRKFTATFDSKSKKTLKNRLKQTVKACANAGSASVDVKKIKVDGTISKDLSSLKLKGKIELEGKADGQKGKATYTFKTNGALIRP